MLRRFLLAAAFGGLVAACGGPQEPAIQATPVPGEISTAALAITTSTTSLVITTTTSAATAPEPTNTGPTTTSATTTAPQQQPTDPTTTAQTPPPTTAPTTTTAPPQPPTTQNPPPTTAPTTTTTTPPLRSLSYRLVAEVNFPIDFVPLPGTEMSIIATKQGTVWVFDREQVLAEPLLEINHLVRNQGEQGLLGVAFHPNFPQSGRMFVHYSANNGFTILAEYKVVGLQADPTSATILFSTRQPLSNHNGGTITFGPDGYLYLGLGDGGGSNDQLGHGQDDTTPLAALLRFDVSTPGMAIPAPDNPFPAPEVWAIGLRNPWRFTIDHPTGLVIIADVGQNNFEEISIAPVAKPGLNYGWPITEGLHCFQPPSGCDTTGLTLPVLEVEHEDANTCSITGGVVYRGQAIPELYGHYFFSDYCGGYLRSFPIERPQDPYTDWTEMVGVPGAVVAFGVDGAGEVYVMTSQGQVLALTAQR